MAQKVGQKKDRIILPHGATIYGKWNKRRYQIVRRIGSGAIGTVFLCRENGKDVAVKMSRHALSLTTEVNVLKSLQQVQDTSLGPFLFDADDWVAPDGTTYSFYAMEYIDGVSIERFVRVNGANWIGVFLMQMLEQLEQFHDAGWVFGDLKNENIIIGGKQPTARFIDVGGTTKIGRSIKEYSDFYDRAYWGLGSREAEPSYDLFALAMIMLAIYYPEKFKRTNATKNVLLTKLYAINELKLYRPCLQKALTGKYRTAKEMKRDLMQTILQLQKSKRKNKWNWSYVIQAITILSISFIYYCLTFL
ncbi:MAG TPA: protein kinase family protein [Pseudogracilibacillus sp.]|nr:protein kinase family protein [Pseudogracilibacillus sp.]